MALALGLRIDRAIGDFDSVSAAGLAAAEAAGAIVERHPAAKDATDLELALDAAIALEPARILVVGSAGGRLDHLLGSILLLADDRYAAATSRCISRRQPDRGDPRLADADGHARRPRHAAARARPGRGRLDERARVSACTTRHSGRARPAVSRTSSPLRKPGSRSRAAAWSPSNPAPSERSPCDTLAQAGGSADHRAGGRGRRLQRLRGRELEHDDEREQGGRARDARLLRDPQAGEGRLRAGERAQADDPAGRRRRRDGQPGAPDEGESPGRRSLRDRQQPALAGARRGPVRALRGRLPRVRRCALPHRPDPCA